MDLSEIEKQRQQSSDRRAELVLASNFDANETTFLSRELTYVRAKALEVVYLELRARLFIPKATDIPAWADSHSYQVLDMVGEARVGSYQGKDIPRVDIIKREEISKCVPITDAWGWTIDEMRKAAANGLPLNDQKAKVARRKIEEKIDLILALGDAGAQTGLPTKGFLNNADVIGLGIVNPANDQWTGSTTADQMLFDLNLGVNTMVEATGQTIVPDTYLLPPKEFNLAAQKRIGTDSSMTVLKFFLETSPYIKNIDQWTRLTGAGAGGASRGVIYKRDPEILEAVINQEFESLPPEAKGLEFEVPCHAKCGGTVVYQPQGMRYVDFAQA